MKKVLIMLSLLWLFLPIKGYAQEKINVYVFTKEQEEISLSLISYLDSLKTDLDCFEYEEYQIWDKDWKEDKELRILADAVAEHFDNQIIGAPVMVVGNHYFDEYSETMQEDIKKTIIDEYEAESYEDVVTKLKEKLADTKAKNEIYTYCILGCFIISIGVLIIISRQNIKKDSI